MKRFLLLALLTIVGAIPLSAQTDAIQGHCTLGGTKAILSGMNSTNYNQGIIPGCTVEVFLTGTTTHATIYSNSTGTPLANPFTAVVAGSPNPGYWIFWAATGQGYDVKMSGGGGNPACTTAPNCYVTPLTYTDLKVGGSGGGGCSIGGPAGVFLVTNGSGGCTVTNIEVNGTPLTSPSPLNFVDTPTVHFTNPALGEISATAMVANSVLFEHNDTNLGGSFAATPQIFDMNDSTPAPPSGFTNVTFQPDPATGRVSAYVPNTATPSFRMQVKPPIAGNYVVVYPTTFTQDSDPPGNSSGFANGTTAAGGYQEWQCSGILCSLAGNTRAHWSGFTLPAGLNPANVTAVYADGITGSGIVNPLWGFNDTYSGTHVQCNGGVNLTPPGGNAPWQAQEVSALTGLTGANFNSLAACDSQVGGSGPGSHGQYVEISAIRFIVYYSGPPLPATTNTVFLQPPLQQNGPDANGNATLLFDESNPVAGHVQGFNLPFPPASSYTYASILGLNTADCSTTSTGVTTWCISNGTSWVPFVAGGGTTTNALTGNSSGGAAPGTTFNGSAAVTFDYHTLGAQQALTLTTAGTSGPATLSGGVLNIPQYTGGGGGGIGGSGTLGYIPLFTPNGTTLGNSHIDDGVTTASTLTASEPIAVNDGSGAAGAVKLQQGTAATNGTNAVTLTVPSSVTSYRVQLPGVEPSGSNTYLSCTAADPAVCSWAAGGGGGGSNYTNVPGSASETTVAAINAVCGTGTYYATTPLSIATGGTVTCGGVQFSASGLWTVASGQTVTFSQIWTETDGPAQHFAGSGTFAFAAGQTVWPENCGAKGDGTTDDHVAIQTCGNYMSQGLMLFRPVTYSLGPGNGTSSFLLSFLGKSGFGLIGYANDTYLTTTSQLNGILQLGGTSISSPTNFDTLIGISALRNAIPGSTADGILVQYAWTAKITGNASYDSGCNFRFVNTASNGVGGILHNLSGHGVGVTSYGGSGWGYCLDASTDIMQSTKGDYNIYFDHNLNGTFSGGGMKLYGPNISDVDWDHFETASVTSYDIQINYTGSGGSYTANDIWIRGAKLDSSKSIPIQVNNVPANTGFIHISDSRINGAQGIGASPNTGAYGIDCESSYGLQVVNNEFVFTGTTAALYFNGCHAATVVGNNFSGLIAGSDGIRETSSSQISTSGNTFRDYVSNTAANAINLIGSSGNSFAADTVLGAMACGIKFDASSNNNVSATNESLSGGTYSTSAICDSGTGNQLSIGGTAGGDLSGTYPNPTVAKLGGIPLCTGITYTTGQFYQYTTASSPNPCITVANAPSGSFSAGGDLSGTSSTQHVIGINSVPLCTGFTPTNGQNLQYTTASSPNPCWTAATGGSGGGGGGSLTNLCSLVTLTNATCSGGVIAVTNGVSTFTVSGIPAGIDLEGTINGSYSGTTSNAGVTAQFNGDTGSHYSFNDGSIHNSVFTTGGWQNINTSTALLIGFLSGTAEPLSASKFTIPAYTSTAVNKTLMGTAWVAGSSTAQDNFYYAGAWTPTSPAAITSITFSAGANTFTNTTLNLYATGAVSGGGAFDGALVTMSSNQSYTGGGSFAAQKMIFGTANYDTHSFWSATNPTRLTVPAGVTNVQLSCGANTTMTGVMLIQLFKNGSSSTYFASPLPSQAGAGGVAFTTPVFAVTAGDYFECAVNDTQNGTINSTGGGTYFSIENKQGLVSSTSNAGKGALLHKTATQTTTNAVETALTWDAADFDDLSFWSAGNPSRITIPSGVSRVRLTCNVNGSVTETATITMRKNGIANSFAGAPQANYAATGSGFGTNATSQVVAVTAGDYFECTYFSGAGAQTVGANWATSFGIQVVQ